MHTQHTETKSKLTHRERRGVRCISFWGIFIGYFRVNIDTISSSLQFIISNTQTIIPAKLKSWINSQQEWLAMRRSFSCCAMLLRLWSALLRSDISAFFFFLIIGLQHCAGLATHHHEPARYTYVPSFWTPSPMAHPSPSLLNRNFFFLMKYYTSPLPPLKRDENIPRERWSILWKMKQERKGGRWHFCWGDEACLPPASLCWPQRSGQLVTTPAGLWEGVWVCECARVFSVGASEITAVQGIMLYPSRHTHTQVNTCFCLLFNRLGPILDNILPKQFCSFFAVRSKKVDSTICEAISLNLLNSSFKLPWNNTKSYEIKSKSYFFLSQFFHRINHD